MPSYLVTGGAGFIGSALVRRLLERGDRVRVVDNFSTGLRRNLAEVLDRIELLEGDLALVHLGPTPLLRHDDAVPPSGHG